MKEVSEEVKKSGEKFQLIVFKLGNEEYALLIDQIKEVVLTPSISKVPLTPSYIKGVANIRGSIIAIVDLEDRFALVSTETETDKATLTKNYTLVIESQDLKMGVLVKEVPNTLTVYESDIDQATELIYAQKNEKNYIKGIVKVDERLIILIDIYQVISQEDIHQSLSN